MNGKKVAEILRNKLVESLVILVTSSRMMYCGSN